MKGHVVKSSCPQCPTDFTVQIWQTSAVLRVWSDLGGETPITNEIWNCYKSCAPRLNSMPYWPESGVHHEPGSVRELYEGSDHMSGDEDIY